MTLPTEPYEYKSRLHFAMAQTREIIDGERGISKVYFYITRPFGILNFILNSHLYLINIDGKGVYVRRW